MLFILISFNAQFYEIFDLEAFFRHGRYLKYIYIYIEELYWLVRVIYSDKYPKNTRKNPCQSVTPSSFYHDWIQHLYQYVEPNNNRSIIVKTVMSRVALPRSPQSFWHTSHSLPCLCPHDWQVHWNINNKWFAWMAFFCRDFDFCLVPWTIFVSTKRPIT